MDLLTRVVAAFESFEGAPYNDAAGHPTIGYGHLIAPGESFPASGILREQALLLLDSDLKEAQRGVDAIFRGAALKDYQRDALTSFVFNLPRAQVIASTLRQRVLTGQWREAGAEFLKWNKARNPHTHELVVLPGLTRRRHCESVWFLGADPATVIYLAQPAKE